ncbi:hypothetical protein Nepgr_033979 [Nepenthes gracilis]|uniref:Uncharacterized protein n=1 Tax=Nepenthes gracilis TaxID=150966 RepID=A0AAD3TLE1_NEPGR|nr:hypothetical protein Nepgr_033979 [Nepenthes gracilis]
MNFCIPGVSLFFVVPNSLELDGSVPDSGPPNMDSPNSLVDPVEPTSVHDIVVNVDMALTPSHGELTLHSSNEEWRDRMPSGPDLLEADPNSTPCQSVKPACSLLAVRPHAQDSPLLMEFGLISNDMDMVAVDTVRLPSSLSSEVDGVAGVDLAVGSSSSILPSLVGSGAAGGFEWHCLCLMMSKNWCLGFFWILQDADLALFPDADLDRDRFSVDVLEQYALVNADDFNSFTMMLLTHSSPLQLVLQTVCA